MEVKSHIDWSDSIWVYGLWDSMPGWKEIRKSFRRTQWYSRSPQEERDFKLKQIL